MSEARVNNLSNESNTGGPTISGITTFSGTNYFVPPVGNTAQRPENPQKGAIRFNTDSKHLEYFRGDGIGWVEVEASNEELNGGNRGVLFGGGSPTAADVMDYHTISTIGSSADFGDLPAARRNLGCGQCSSRTRGFAICGDVPGPTINDDILFFTFASLGSAVDSGFDIGTDRRITTSLSNETRGIVAGGYEPENNVIEYISLQSVGVGADFGDLTAGNRYFGYGSASTTRGLIAGGVIGPVAVNSIEYITISTTGDAADFGDIAVGDGRLLASAANSTRSILASGGQDSYSNVIEYVTIATLGNSVDFADIDGTDRRDGSGTSSPTRAVFSCGYNGSFQNKQDYVEIMTLGNSKDFGDAAGSTVFRNGGCSNGHGGL